RIIALDLPEPSAELDDPGFDLRELRRVATSLDHEDAGLALTAVAMGAWHRSMRHCPRCGAPLEAEEAGWVLRCTEEGTQNFPRTDPAVIMAVRDGRDRLLLARNARFRGTFHSVLAGFVEPGETLEAAVAREVAEEVGVLVEEVEYAGSQPWPFPRSLMLGFRAWARTDQDAVLDLQDEEIAEAAWYTREEVTAALAEGRLSVPSTASIARGLIEDWYGGPLPAEH
ncbi:MAG: NAD(+) diphosphatase, partial [Brachybacterium sp.]|nr:NAD(+) diphosphatase [Brachybacterium sp.]